MKTPPAGSKFGRLEFSGAVRRTDRVSYVLTEYECRCECGNVGWHPRANLVTGKTKSCGCLSIEMRTVHGKTDSPEYVTWDNMVQRVTNPNNRSREHYFDRKIDMDPRWLSFEEFFKDMGDRPPGTTLERKDNDLGYWPSNCIWATRDVQNNNTRRNRKVMVRGETMNMSQACAKYGINITTVYARLSRGMSVESAITGSVAVKGSKKRKTTTNNYTKGCYEIHPC